MTMYRYSSSPVGCSSAALFESLKRRQTRSAPDTALRNSARYLGLKPTRRASPAKSAAIVSEPSPPILAGSLERELAGRCLQCHGWPILVRDKRHAFDGAQKRQAVGFKR